MKSYIFILSLVIHYCVNAQPIANFSANKVSGCSPLSVQFQDASTGFPTSFQWTFGNGNTSTLQNPSAIYIIPGVYNVSLTVSNLQGTNTLTKSAFITVFTSPTAHFSNDKNGGCVPLVVQFTDSTSPGSGVITKWLWDFGDGNVSIQKNPNHTYIIPGFKNISLTVTDTNGCTNTTLKSNHINVTQSHMADFTVTNPIACKAPTTHQFTPTVNPANTSYTYEWMVSNGQGFNTISPTLNLTQPGIYNVMLKVTAPNGCAAIVNKPSAIFIADIQNDFTVPTSGLCALNSIQFSNQTVPDTNALLHRWFVNGTLQSNSKNYQNSFNAGTYQLRLISSFNQCADTVDKNIVIHPKPVALFVASPNSICKIPTIVQFTNQSTGSSLNYNWSFGNGKTSTLPNDTVHYNALTFYQASLLVTDSNGCRDSSTVQLPVFSPSVQVINHNVKKGCKPFATNFGVVNTSQFIRYRWFINGIQTDTNSTFNYTFNDTGTFIVRVLATTANNCDAELFDTVKVGMNIPFDFTADKFSACFSAINPVQFTAIENSGITGLTYAWIWKNGSANGKITQATIPDTGIYNITLTITHNGCLSTLTKLNYINVNPARASMWRPNVPCGSDSATFDATNSAGTGPFQWFFGDGATSNQAIIGHKYNSTGYYNVMVVVRDTVFNCIDTARNVIFISKPPQLKFTQSDSIGCAPIGISLSNTTVIDSNHYPIAETHWQFSTGENAFGLNQSITLFTSGWRGLTMQVKDIANCVYSIYKDSAVRVSGGVADFTSSANAGCVPLTVQFSDQSITDFPVIKRKWLWNGIDSTLTDTQKNVQFTFQQPNFIKQRWGIGVVYEIQDSIGCYFYDTLYVIPTKPQPSFDISTALLCGSQQITFTADTNESMLYAPAQFNWLVGNQPRTGRVIQNTFAQRDTTIAIRLAINDANGCTAQMDTNIRIVNIKPTLGFYATPNVKDCYLPISPVQLFDTSIIGSTPIVSRLWRIDDNESSAESPFVTFTLPGKYDVTLTLTDSAGCKDSLTITDYIRIGGPLGTYSFGPLVGCNPLPITFKLKSENAKYFIWDFGDGRVDTATTDSFTYQYSTGNIYYPRLTLVDSSESCVYGFEAKDSIIIYNKPQVDFDLDKTLVCANTLIEFTNKSVNQPVMKNWLWRFGSNDTSHAAGPITKSFDAAGKYTIQLMGIDTNGCADTAIREEVLYVFNDVIAPARPVSIRATVLDYASNVFEFRKNTEPDFIKYRVFYNYAGGQPLNYTDYFFADDTLFTQQNITTYLNPYSYAVVAVDVCNNVSDTAVKHTTVELQAKGINNAVSLKWTPYVGFSGLKNYEIWRNNTDSPGVFVLIKTVSPLTYNYVDTTVKCFTNYVYQLKAVSNATPTVVSWSDTALASPIFLTTLPGTKNFRATVVDDDVVLLQWYKRDAELRFKYMIYRKRGDEADFTYYKEVSDTFLIDDNVQVDLYTYVYVIYLKDECGGISLASDEAKTILVKVDLTETSPLDFDPIVHFTPYSKWQAGVLKYQVDFHYDSSSSFYTVANLTNTDTAFIDVQQSTKQRDYCYKVVAYENGGNNATSESNIACIETKPKVFVPNVFTVNGDKLNDVFRIRGVFIDTYHLEIYDRWGRLIFESNDIENSWDGTIDGKPAPADVYTYLVEAGGRKKQKEAVKGTVTLIR